MCIAQNSCSHIKHLLCLVEQYFGVKEDQVPLIIIQTNDGQKYLKAKLEPDHIAPWVKEYQVKQYSDFCVWMVALLLLR